jgi:stage II sporulation protein D
MLIRIGFLHRREQLLLRLPAGSRWLGPWGEHAAEGELHLSRTHGEPALVRRGLKLLETADPGLLAAAQTRLHSAGFATEEQPFAPGGHWGGPRAAATRLLWLPLGTARPAGGDDHLQLDHGDDEARHALLEVRSALGDLAGRPSGAPPPALWHLGAPLRYQQILKPARAALTLSGPAAGACAGQIREIRQQPATARAALRVLPPAGGSIEVAEVEIGIGFHWQHRRSLVYEGAIELFLDASGRLGLLNEIDLEAYLASVNSSEMTADCPPALLEAQTIAARSTVLATRGRHHHGEPFDLCADDHCQCFRGAGQVAAASRAAAQATAGQVLVHGGLVCDARYSKSCGGIVEAYEQVWEDQPVPYLGALCDTAGGGPPPERDEAAWQAWIGEAESVWCNTEGEDLPPGLAYGGGYYRWSVERSRRELAASIRRRTGREFGQLLDLRALSRGRSGRLTALEVLTDAGSFIIGKELAIRLALSETCLYSAAIRWHWRGDTLIIEGKGWGHGVGLCQLGATRMALAGLDAGRILAHYYPGTHLETLPASERNSP